MKSNNTLAIAGWTIFVAIFLSCSSGPVIPRTVQSKTISYSGTNQTAGIIDNGVDFVIEPRTRDKYNALIEKYGRRIMPPIEKDFGIKPTRTNTYVITPEALVYFGEMNQWHNQGRK